VTNTCTASHKDTVANEIHHHPYQHHHRHHHHHHHHQYKRHVLEVIMSYYLIIVPTPLHHSPFEIKSARCLLFCVTITANRALSIHVAELVEDLKPQECEGSELPLSIGSHTQSFSEQH
jgi:hypothetical protein